MIVGENGREGGSAAQAGNAVAGGGKMQGSASDYRLWLVARKVSA